MERMSLGKKEKFGKARGADEDRVEDSGGPINPVDPADSGGQADAGFRAPLALVTGGASGIGLEFSRLLAARGYDLLLVGRSEEKLGQAASALIQTYGPERPSLSVETISCDLSLHDGARRLHEECSRRGFRVDLLINNAGRGIFGPLIEQDTEELTAMVRLNVESLMLLTRLFAADMIDRGDLQEGSFETVGGADSAERPIDRLPAYILNIGSVAGRMPMPRFAAYGASKSFVREFTVAVQQELKGLRRAAEKRGRYIRPVYVSILEPGYVRTAFDDNAGIESEGYRRFSSKNAMTPQQIADIGLRGLFAAKPVIVAGFQNRLMIALSRLVPGRAIARIVWNAVSGLIQ